ncbi:MAG TPA: SPOR domain-containing protein [Steroidobacteraceae bacterium]|nr:SPOR domain-containing protein [Steroidobacteraceae bacterium]
MLESLHERPNVDIRVKERLTGAVILVALVVLVVPELLSGPKRPLVSTATPSELPPLSSYTVELGEEAHRPLAPTTPPQAQGADSGAGTQPVPAGDAARESAPGASSAATAAPSAAATSVAASATTAAAAAPQSSAVSTPHAQASTAAPPSTDTAHRSAQHTRSQPSSAGGWCVQVGSFASRGNADRLARELQHKGFHASILESTHRGHSLYRVRVGPEHEHTAAVALAGRLHAAGVGGSVVPLP